MSPKSAEGVPVAEVAVVAAIAGQHVLDHLVVPRRFHLATHLASAGAAVMAALATGASLDELGLEPRRAAHGLRRGLGSAAVITAAIGLGAALPRTRAWFDDERVLDVEPGEALFRGLVEIPLGTAVYEEVIFRGVIHGFAARRMAPLPAMALSSVLFGLWHVLPSLSDRDHHPLTREQHPAAVVAATVANTAVVGLSLAWQRQRTGSIVAPIITHTASNAVAYLAAVALASRRRSVAAEDDMGGNGIGEAREVV
jgi:membrane protease YdiL (CAAX protease family)